VALGAIYRRGMASTSPDRDAWQELIRRSRQGNIRYPPSRAECGCRHETPQPSAPGDTRKSPWRRKRRLLPRLFACRCHPDRSSWHWLRHHWPNPTRWLQRARIGCAAEVDFRTLAVRSHVLTAAWFSNPFGLGESWTAIFGKASELRQQSAGSGRGVVGGPTAICVVASSRRRTLDCRSVSRRKTMPAYYPPVCKTSLRMGGTLDYVPAD